MHRESVQSIVDIALVGVIAVVSALAWAAVVGRRHPRSFGGLALGLVVVDHVRLVRTLKPLPEEADEPAL